MGKIKYVPEQHQQFQSELQKISDVFSELITELGNVKSAASTHLKGEATESLLTAIEELTSKLSTAQSNWQTTNDNAKRLENAIKSADEEASRTVNQ